LFDNIGAQPLPEAQRQPAMLGQSQGPPQAESGTVIVHDLVEGLEGSGQRQAPPKPPEPIAIFQ